MLNFTRGSPFPPSPGRRGRGAPSPVGYPPEQVTPQGLHDFGQRSTQNLRLEEPSVEKPLPAAPVSVTVASVTSWTGRPASSALCPGLCGHAVQCVLIPVEPPSCRNLLSVPGHLARPRSRRRPAHLLPPPALAPRSPPPPRLARGLLPYVRMRLLSPHPQEADDPPGTPVLHLLVPAPPRPLPPTPGAEGTCRSPCPGPATRGEPSSDAPSLAAGLPAQGRNVLGARARRVTHRSRRQGRASTPRDSRRGAAPRPRRCRPEVAGDARTAGDNTSGSADRRVPPLQSASWRSLLRRVPAALPSLPSQATTLTSGPNTPLTPCGRIPSGGLSATADAPRPSPSSSRKRSGHRAQRHGVPLGPRPAPWSLGAPPRVARVKIETQAEGVGTERAFPPRGSDSRTRPSAQTPSHVSPRTRVRGNCGRRSSRVTQQGGGWGHTGQRRRHVSAPR